MDRLRFKAPALFLLLLMIDAIALQASSILQVSVDQMLKKSELVFEGTVIGITPHWGPSRIVETDVAFEVNDVIKGSLNKPVIVLTFTGGSLDGMTFTIADMQMPAYREHGVYFVESLQRQQVHPFYGWEQGHFLVKANRSGTPIVTTSAGRAVLDIQSERLPGQRALSTGTAFGVRTSGITIDSSAMTLTAFKAGLRRLNK